MRVLLATLLLTALAGSGSVAAAVVPEASAWSPCPDRTAIECARLDVPVDISDPASATVALPIRRTPALRRDRRLGVLVTIAGGPGQRGTDWVVPGLHTPAIHEHFDIVSWDPRGTSGESLIECIPEWDPFAGFDRTPDSDLERRQLDARTAALAEQCRTEYGDLLPFVGTVEAAHDLERLRQMLGEEQISILGTSYGSKVALTYATLFPEHVRAIVLDAYSDPNLPPDGLQLEQAASFERELDDLLAGCAADADCPFHNSGRPGEALDRLLAGLDVEAVPTGDPDRPLHQSDAYEAITASLIRDKRARLDLLRALAAATAGDGTWLRTLADETREVFETSGLTLGAFMAVDCADTGAYWAGLDRDQITDLTAAIEGVAPRLGPWLWSPPADPALPPVGLCAMQPFHVERGLGAIDAAGAGTVLVLTTTGDPTTPAAGAARSSSDLQDAVVLTLDEDHHLAYHIALSDPTRPAYACVLDAVETHLIDLVPPSIDHDCGR